MTLSVSMIVLSRWAMIRTVDLSNLSRTVSWIRRSVFLHPSIHADRRTDRQTDRIKRNETKRNGTGTDRQEKNREEQRGGRVLLLTNRRRRSPHPSQGCEAGGAAHGPGRSPASHPTTNRQTERQTNRQPSPVSQAISKLQANGTSEWYKRMVALIR